MKVPYGWLALAVLGCVGCSTEKATPAPIAADQYIASCIGIGDQEFDPPAVLCVGGTDGSLREVGVTMTPGVAPALSADRSRIAVVDSDRLVIVNSNGVAEAELTNQSGIVGVQWHPDGTALVVLRKVAEAATIEQINIADSATTVLVAEGQLTGEIARGIAVSPDGTQLAYAIRTDDRSELRLVSLETGGQQVIRESEDFISAPDWSSDGVHIAAVVGAVIESIDAGDGSHEVRAATGRDITTPTWSPDNQRLMFVDSRGALLMVTTGETTTVEAVVDYSGGGTNARFPAFPQWD